MWTGSSSGGPHRKPYAPESFLPIRAPPWTEDYGWLAANDEVDLPFFEDYAA